MTLNVSRLEKRFGTTCLFRGLGFQMGGGETLAVVGANGSGKSTLLKILAGVLSPSAGVVALAVNGREVAPEDRMRYAGLVSSEVHMYANLSARENLHFLVSARGGKECGAEIGAILNRVGLSSRDDLRVRAFSSGMVQRLRIAVALLFNPPLLLLDEPMVNLDSAGRDLVAEVLRSVSSSGRIAVYATNVEAELATATMVLDLQEYT